MTRRLFWPLWLVALLACLTPVGAYWQSRDSNYNISAGGSPPACCILDGRTTGLTFAISTRKLISAYAGAAIQVNSTTDIGFASNVLDTAALSAACGAGSCTITKWYNQNGTGDFTTTNTTFPIISAGGVVNTINTKPAAAFNGTTTDIESAISALPANTLFLNAVILPTSFVVAHPMVGPSGGGGVEFRSDPTTGTISLLKATVANVGTSSGTLTAATGAIVEVSYLQSTGDFTFWINRVSAGTGTNAQTFSAANFVIGNAPSWSEKFLGNIGEVIAYDVAGGVSTPDRQAIRKRSKFFLGDTLKKLVVILSVFLLASYAFAWNPHAIGTQGGGANLLIANQFSPPFGAPVSSRTLDRPASSTADYYHIAGFTFTHPYDLLTMGTPGATIAAAKGARYVWFIAPDHPEGFFTADENQIYSAFSNDPAILPDPGTMTAIIPTDGNDPTNSNPMVPHLVYNPDDPTNPFYIYTEGINGNAGGTLHEVLWKRADFDGQFTYVGVSHEDTGCITSYQTVYRIATGNWISFGGNVNCGPANGSLNGFWTSTDGVTFTQASTFITSSGNSTWPNLNEEGLRVTVGANTFIGSREENCSAACNGGGNRLGQYLSFAPIDPATGNLVTGGSPPITRLSTAYAGIYPGPSFVNGVFSYCEDGICLHQVAHGFFSNVPPGPPVPFPGIQEQYLDLYANVTDPTAAVNAAPMGVRVSAAAGTATLTWYDLNPNHTYRVYRSTSAGTQGSLLGNPTTGTFSDTPTASSSCTLYFYRVYTLNSGVEEGFRTVSTFVSSSTALVNKHITRACTNGADFATINRSWLDAVDAFLVSNNLEVHVQAGADAEFGVVWNSGTGVASRIFDLGTTVFPRNGDLTFIGVSTHTTTYNATVFGSNAVPGWVNADTQSWGAWGLNGKQTATSGRVNNIKTAAGTGTLVAVYKNATAFHMELINSVLNGGFGLETTAAADSCSRCASFGVSGLFGQGSPTLDQKTLAGGGTGFNITAGTYDGTTATVFVEGVAGAGSGPGPAPGTTNNPFSGVAGSTNVPFLIAGSNAAAFTWTAHSVNGTYGISGAGAQTTNKALWEFDVALTPTQVAAFTTLYRNHIGP